MPESCWLVTFSTAALTKWFGLFKDWVLWPRTPTLWLESVIISTLLCSGPDRYCTSLAMWIMSVMANCNTPICHAATMPFHLVQPWSHTVAITAGSDEFNPVSLSKNYLPVCSNVTKYVQWVLVKAFCHLYLYESYLSASWHDYVFLSLFFFFILWHQCWFTPRWSSEVLFMLFCCTLQYCVHAHV